MKKKELRKTFLERQKELDKAERDRRTAQVVKSLFENFDFTETRFLNCFITLEKNNELDTFEIFQKIWREFPQITTSAPRINRDQDVLEIVVCSPETKYVENSWGILEPSEDEKILEPKELDVVLIPLIAFDEQGFRCGYGKGYYDKFLSKCRADCRKIGLSLFPPVEKIEDVGGWDVPLDACIESEKIWEFKPL